MQNTKDEPPACRGACCVDASGRRSTRHLRGSPHRPHHSHHRLPPPSLRPGGRGKPPDATHGTGRDAKTADRWGARLTGGVGIYSSPMECMGIWKPQMEKNTSQLRRGRRSFFDARVGLGVRVGLFDTRSSKQSRHQCSAMTS